MKMSNTLVVVALSTLMITSNVYAGIHECISTDAAHTLKVTLDQDANTVTINGDKKAVHPPAAGGPEGVLVVTDPFDTEEYGEIYISVSNNKEGKVVISQVGVKDKETKVSFILDCK